MDESTTKLHSRLTLDDRRIELIVGLLLWVAAFLLYAVTAGPGIVELFDDSLEFQLVAPTFGIAHPTGYPLYTILGGLWSRLLFPIGNWAWRMNLFSALSAASAIVLIYFCANRLVSRNNPSIWPGLAAAGALAFGPVWWSQATVAEVYALHGLLMAAILLTALTLPRLCTNGCDLSRGTPAFRRILLLTILVGLSLTHHRMSVLLLPGLFVYSLLVAPQIWRPRREWLYWIAGLLIPMMLYLYIPLRAAMGVRDLNGSYVNTVGGFFNHILARQYSAFFSANSVGQVVDWQAMVELTWRQMGMIALVLALLAFVAMPFCGKVTRANWALLAITLIANILFVHVYQVADWPVFLIPSFLIAALFTGAGISLVASQLTRIRYAPTAVSVLLVALILVGFWGRAPAVDRSADWEAHQYAYLLAAADYAPGSLLIGIEGEMSAVQFMQASEELAAGVSTQAVDDPEARAEAVIDSVAQGTPTYITRELPQLADQYTFSSVGEAIRVWPRGSAQVATLAIPLDLDVLPDRLQLESYELDVVDVPCGQVLELTLGWLPTDQVNQIVKVSLRLQHDNGSPVIDEAGLPIVADRFPVRQTALSTDWAPNQLIRDTHMLSIPVTDEPMTLLTIVYDAESTQELARFEAPVTR